ncbi:MAG: hypothetical protein AAF587_22630 [Bacteroidota bacterium]
MDDSTYLQLYQYLNEEMEPNERAAFEQKIQEDKALAQEVEFHRDVLLGVEWAEDQTLANKIAKNAAKLEEEGFFETGGGMTSSDRNASTAATFQIRSLFRPRYYAIAASLLVLLIIGWFLSQSSNPYQKVYANHYEVDRTSLQEQLTDLSKSGMATPDIDRRTQLLAALKQLELANYSQASLALKNHLTAYPTDEVASLFLGQSLMQESQYNEAVRVLQPVADAAGPFQQQARWYLGLALLQADDQEMTPVDIFSEIARDTSSPYQTQAMNILKQIDPDQ